MISFKVYYLDKYQWYRCILNTIISNWFIRYFMSTIHWLMNYEPFRIVGNYSIYKNNSNRKTWSNCIIILLFLMHYFHTCAPCLSFKWSMLSLCSSLSIFLMIVLTEFYFLPQNLIHFLAICIDSSFYFVTKNSLFFDAAPILLNLYYFF